jgi:phage antirepressor YoqD-like protein
MHLITSNNLTMSSREIADVTEKNHSHVLRDIRTMLCELYPDLMTKENPKLDLLESKGISVVFSENGFFSTINLPKRETLILVSGYSMAVRAAIIDRWQELETQVAPALPDFNNPVAAARAWADAKESEQKAVARLEAAQPAIEFVERYVEARSEKGIREVAKILGIKQNEFIADLLDRKILFRQGPNLLPYAYHQDKGRFVVKTGETNGHAYIQTRFTPQGVAWIASLVA